MGARIEKHLSNDNERVIAEDIEIELKYNPFKYNMETDAIAASTAAPAETYLHFDTTYDDRYKDRYTELNIQVNNDQSTTEYYLFSNHINLKDCFIIIDGKAFTLDKHNMIIVGAEPFSISKASKIKVISKSKYERKYRKD
jgi:hypothetical protein